MNQPEPQSLPFPTLMHDIEHGIVKIPQFQRDFVWGKDKSARLLDSILKGYPIGTFILWKTKELLRTVRNLGNATLPDTPPGDFVQYILDGQQRLTSLFASVKGLKVKREEREDDFAKMFVDLDAREDQQIVVIDTTGKNPEAVVRVIDLVNQDFTFFAAFPKKYYPKLNDYKTHLESYAFSVVLIKERSIDVATEIFTRLNVSGKPLSVFEIMVAKTFDTKRDFDLAEKHDELAAALREVDYDTVPPAVILQAVSGVLVKECSSKEILKLDKQKFIDAWPRTVEAIYRAVEYFRNFHRVPVSRLLPYNSLLVPFTYFFYHHPDKPVGEQQKYLQDFFWRSSLSGRYSSGAEGKLAQDLKRVDEILAGKLPKYDYAVDTSAEFIRKNGWFSAGRSFVKAILCLLAYHQPKSFIDHSIVRISNDWLKQANSKNYHHFFPQAYMKKHPSDNGLPVNHVANITIVDEFLNKRQIRDLPPSKYMLTFKKKNPDLRATMDTHLIDLDRYGVWDDDYERFFKMRCRVLSKELAKRVIPQEIDERGQEPSVDDYEDLESEGAEPQP